MMDESNLTSRGSLGSPLSHPSSFILHPFLRMVDRGGSCPPAVAGGPPRTARHCRSTFSMFRRFASTAAVAALLIGVVVAADKEIKGKVVKYDPATRDITVKTADGDDEQRLGADAKVFDAKGVESKDGPKDKRIAKGAEVK